MSNAESAVETLVAACSGRLDAVNAGAGAEWGTLKSRIC
jgi:hypothetical protein